MAKVNPTGVRIPENLLKWADTLAPDCGDLADFRGLIRPKRSDVLRAALRRGLGQLDAEVVALKAAERRGEEVLA